MRTPKAIEQLIGRGYPMSVNGQAQFEHANGNGTAAQTADEDAKGFCQRLELIKALSDARKDRTLITYVTSTRPGLEASMAADVIPIIHEHLQELGISRERDCIDLLLHTDGGDGMVPWRLMTLLREFAKEIAVLVPHRCYSAGTLTALGADEILMHPMGSLGPTDPTSHTPFNPVHPLENDRQVGVAVEDVNSYVQMVKDLGINNPEELTLAFSLLASQVHPLALGNVKRLNQQMTEMGKKMLSLRNGSGLADPDAVVRTLNAELFSHDHPISRDEAREKIGLIFVENPSSEIETAMWDLYSAYAQDMRLHEAFDFYAEVTRRGQLPSPPIWRKGSDPPPPTVQRVRLNGVRYVYLESSARSDRCELDLEVTVARHWDGPVETASLVTGTRWRTTQVLAQR